MHFIRSFCFCTVLVFLSFAVHAQSQAFFFDDSTMFEKASQSVRTINFEAVAPAKGFGKYAPDVGLSVGGISFRTHGGARFGSGTIYVPSAHYIAGNPGLKMLDGAHLSWGAPNQPGNAHLELTFPARVKAFGADIWASQPIVSPIEITVTTRDGRSHTSTITTRKRPDSTFIGFVSDLEIASLRFTLAKGQTSLLLDNLAYGGRAEGVDLAALAAELVTSPTRMEDEVRSTRPDTVATRIENKVPSAQTSRADVRDSQRPASAPQPVKPVDMGRSGPISPSNASGSIAYVRDGKEIRSISPDGSNDRRFWTHADVHEGLGINELAWSPDGSELAFSSGHEAVASFYHADIFSIKPNGTGLRRVTNGPDRSDYAKYGKGTVTVTVRNDQPI